MNIFENYIGGLNWLEKNTVFLTIHGSHAYGTNITGSDLDFKGFCVSPKEYYLGYANKFEQAEIKTNVDAVVYDIRKFFSLASACNPSIIEVLWTDESDHIIVDDLIKHIVLPNRDRFLSKEVYYTFRGFARSQLKRINTHRKWLLNPILDKPKRKDYKLKENPEIPKNQLSAAISSVKKVVDSWEIDFGDMSAASKIYVKNQIEEHLAAIDVSRETLWKNAARLLGYESNFIEYIQKEKEYNTAYTEWRNYNQWVNSRNSKRTELEAKCGYDSKNASHLVRLIRMCGEILETSQVIVKRPDAKELLEIRNGGWTYDELMNWSNEQELKLSELHDRSQLPRRANEKYLNNLCVEIVCAWHDRPM